MMKYARCHHQELDTVTGQIWSLLTFYLDPKVMFSFLLLIVADFNSAFPFVFDQIIDFFVVFLKSICWISYMKAPKFKTCAEPRANLYIFKK